MLRVSLGILILLPTAGPHAAAGTLYAWGWNEHGEVNAPPCWAVGSPVQIPALDGIIRLAGGHSHSLALTADDTVWAWGRNESGQLGDGTYNTRSTPMPVPGLSGVVDIAAGTYFNLALLADGTVRSWGAGTYYALGDGSYVNRLTPVTVSGLSNVVAISAGSAHGMALKSDGTVWVWGANDYGALGLGYFGGASATPIQVPNLSQVVRISAGGWFSLVVKSDGTVWSWGKNDYGQLGIGSSTNQCSPVQVNNLTDIVAACAARGNHSVALTRQGAVYTWGESTWGQLGDNYATSYHRTVPAIVPNFSNAVAIAAGQAYSVAIKADGSLWGWGQNGRAQIGLGYTSDGVGVPRLIGIQPVRVIGPGWQHCLAFVEAEMPPSVMAGPDAAIEAGSTFLGGGSFTDPNPGTWSGTVDYGGSGTEPLPLNEDKTFTLQHVYPIPGMFNVTVTVTDQAGLTGTDTVQVIVSDHQPPLITCPDAITVPADRGTCSASGVVLGAPTVSDNVGVSSLTNDAPSVFPQGPTVVTWTATDASGNVATCPQTVTVADREPPNLTAPEPITLASDAGRCEAEAVLNPPAAIDNCGTPTITSDAPTLFPVGTTYVTWTATDTSGNVTATTQKVLVEDRQAPVIPAPAPLQVATDPGQCSASNVPLTPPASTDNCGIQSLISNAPPVFPKGDTIVTWTATDASGNTTTCIQTVTVVDSEPPTLTGTAGLTLATDPGRCEATDVSLTPPAATDNCQLLSLESDAPSAFPKGDTVVQWTARDASGNIATLIQVVTVADREPPTLATPDPVTVAADTGRCEATGVTLVPPAATDNCGIQSLTHDAPPVFSSGTTIVTWTATDTSGQQAICRQAVTVVDQEPPVIPAMPDIEAAAGPDTCSAQVFFDLPLARDNCGNVTVSATPPSGGVFPCGSTTVTVRATDASGNTSTQTFQVVVADRLKPVARILTPPSGALFQVNTPVLVGGAYEDNSAIRADSAVWTFSCAAGVIQRPGLVDPAMKTIGLLDNQFGVPGVYDIGLAVTDAAGNTSDIARVVSGTEDPAYIVVYDPSGGYVTGGGTIYSPPGACRMPGWETAEGRAHFGFVSRYRKGAQVPEGHTDFRFKAGNLDFRSRVYEWLVVSGARAQYKGVGEIDRQGDYGFLLTAVDGDQTGGGGLDRFRIKIWDRASGAIVYDNQGGEDDNAALEQTTVITSGKIVIERG